MADIEYGGTKRITELGEQTELAGGEYLVVDHDTNGTRKITPDDLVNGTSLKSDLEDIANGRIMFDLIANSYVRTDGTFEDYNGWSRTDLIPVSDIDTLKIISTAHSAYNVFYDENRAKINNFVVENGDISIQLAENVKYIALSNTTEAMKNTKLQAEITRSEKRLDELWGNVIKNLMIGSGVAEKIKGYLVSEMSNTYIENGSVVNVAWYASLSDCHKLPFAIDVNFGDLSFKITKYNSDNISDFNVETAWNTATKRIHPNTYFTIHVQKNANSLPLDEVYSKMNVQVPDIISSLNSFNVPLLNYATQYSNPNRFQLLWFSDIHADTKRLRRIVEYMNNHKSELSDAICTGDMLADKVTDDYTFWDTAGAGNILTIIGNHDGNTGSGWASNKTMYDKFFAPYIEDWGVTYTADYCNWYKVYNNSIMLIGLCAVNSTTAEVTEMLSFLNTALNVAKTNNYAVVIAHHYPSNPAHTTKYNTPFETIGFTPTDLFIPESVFSAVEDFKDNGGEFVCYITGHTHADLSRFRTLEKQIVLTVSTAYISAGMQEYAQYRAYDTKYEDLFNIFYVDRNKKIVSIKRIGSDRDVWFRKLDYLAINYETAEMI